jgi:carboxymethylenebutenolidase
VVKEIKPPVLGLYGGKDTGIPVADVEKMREALKAAGKTSSEIVLYPNAAHGFHADYRPGYDKEAATDAWSRLLAWFKKNGVA